MFDAEKIGEVFVLLNQQRINAKKNCFFGFYNWVKSFYEHLHLCFCVGRIVID